MRRAHSRAPSARRSGASSWPTRARFFWTKSATSRWSCSPSCCAFCRSASSSGWAARAAACAAGELKAIGLKNGKIVATKSLRTVGPAKKVRLTVDRATIRADRNDLAYVTVEITDASGSVLPDASNLVHFKLTGPGELAAVGSGAPNVMESFRQPQHTAWHGRALAIMRPLGPTGKLVLRAEADGLSAGQVMISVK